MCCLQLTKEELIRGEQVFRQLEREKNEKIQLEAFFILFMIIPLITIEDWKYSNIMERGLLLFVYSPLLYVVYEFLVL